jgi:hypothetical protein
MATQNVETLSVLSYERLERRIKLAKLSGLSTETLEKAMEFKKAIQERDDRQERSRRLFFGS